MTELADLRLFSKLESREFSCPGHFGKTKKHPTGISCYMESDALSIIYGTNRNHQTSLARSPKNILLESRLAFALGFRRRSDQCVANHLCLWSGMANRGVLIMAKLTPNALFPGSDRSYCLLLFHLMDGVGWSS